MSIRSSDYLDECPECGGWIIRFANETYNEELARTEFTVICRGCGSTWRDFIDD